MRRLVLSCLAAVLAILGLSVASSGAPGSQPAAITVVQAAPDAAIGARVEPARIATGSTDPVAGRASTSAVAQEREPVFLRLLALTTLVAGVGACARHRTVSRRRVG